MSLSPEEVAELTAAISMSATLEYIHLGLYTFFCYHYLTTIAEEVAIMWPQKWKTGKSLFLLPRYGPIVLATISILTSFRNYLVIAPKVCRGLAISYESTFVAYSLAAEVILLLCLHALMGAKVKYLALIMLVFWGLSLGAIFAQLDFLAENSRAAPLAEFDQGLGYPCTWAGVISPSAFRGARVTAYISLSKSICMFVLSLVVFFWRYRSKGGSLITTLRRDSGLYIFSLTAIRLANTLAILFNLRLGQSVTTLLASTIISGIQKMIVPVLACQLLLNIRKASDPGVQTVVSTILFDPPVTNMGTRDEYEDSSSQPMEMAHFSGLGRRRAVRKPEPDPKPPTAATGRSSYGADVGV
ncbi:hypothetical protein DFP72DRAFT_900840 [Ephemerocybe angulata]|uniref:DUF6533 domain-containing protein n=1 Tax=Ephemerocybe angulata TaxID=980116 RepID=A0A8H6M5L9_9AGAR|nr:hypothetical protein DFP72DRAFT_900840 [Tulosesus angulatus]